MARTNLPLTLQAANGVTLNNAGTAIDQPNGMNIQLPTTGIPANSFTDRLLIYATNTFAGTKTVTIRAGVGGGATAGAAFRSGIGDLVTGNLAASTGIAFIGPLDASRFVQLDGSINIDFASGITGLIWAILLQRWN